MSVSCQRKLLNAERGNILVVLLGVIAVVAFFGTTVLSRTVTLGSYRTKYKKLQQRDGIYQWVQGMTACPPVAACADPMELRTTSGKLLVDAAGTPIEVNGFQWTMRARCAAGVVTILLRSETLVSGEYTFNDAGSFSCI